MTKALEKIAPEAELAEVRRPGAITAEDFMPLLDMATAIRRRNFMVEVTRNLMVDGVDYGVIPGTESKPTLLKPGAERLCTLFGLSPELHEVATIEDWTGEGEGHGGEPLFYYRYKVRLMKNGILLGEGTGSCNSREIKFRYRTAERKCPKCGKAAIIRGKQEYGGGWICFAKKGGCGAKFPEREEAIVSQPAGRVANPDVADVVNTIQKMAHKRALVAAVLIATNASEFYTQDSEDMEVIDIPVAQPPKHQTNPDGPAKPWTTFREMIDTFARLHTRLGAEDDHLYRETLRKYGVEHSNQFKKVPDALAAYAELLAIVQELEDRPTTDEAVPEPEDV